MFRVVRLAAVCLLSQAILASGHSATPSGAASSGTSAPPRLIPTAELAEHPLMTGLLLSPDGKRVAATINSSGSDAVGIIDIAVGQPRIFSLGEKRDLRWYRWAGDGTILVSVGNSVTYSGDEAYMTRLMAIDVATGKVQFIGAREEGLVGDDVLWVDPEGKTLLMAYQKTIYDYPSVFSVDIATNRRKEVIPQRTGIWDWYADDHGIVRAGLGFGPSGRWTMIYRASESDKFKTVVKAREDDDEAGYDAVRIFQGSDEGYIIRNNEKTGLFALYKFNFATRQVGDLIFESTTNDIDDFDLSSDGKALLAAWYTDDKERVHWFDPAMQEIQKSLDEAVGGRTAWIVSRSRNDRMLIVNVGASNNPGAYYVYQPDTGVMKLYAKVSEKLKPSELAVKRYEHYKARDGLEISAYLTLPRGREARNLPLILLPHGGPYDIRDTDEYDAEVQFLANRGYAVLQPQYRGSGGYGKSFYEKGEGQWGRSMQDDIDDGMDWLAKNGVIDPKRVCIVGSSYGGYAALWGAVRNPERYRCAASFAGISDLKRQLNFQLDFKISRKYRKDWRKRVQGAETFDLRSVSPLFTIDKLSVPVLMMHGDDDQRVPYKQSKLYADALQQAGKTYEFYTLKGEGHGFSTSANMQQWLDRLDAFLRKYNPAN